jgi:hypothetical protein
MNNIGKLGVGPMSEEIVEAVFSYSENTGEPLMLIASKNQIDWDGGYVNRWTTKEYVNYVNKIRKQYPKAKVFVCRDHLGPGFKNYDLTDVYKTMDSDIENGFDLIHVDFCHFKGDREELLNESKKAIEYIRSKKPDMLLEVGTDENAGVFLENVEAIEKDMAFFSSIAPLQFFVVQTGSLTKEQNQAGGFNAEFIAKIKERSKKYGVGLKEHNGDYIEKSEIQKRKGLIDAMNVAPQFGVIQTMMTLQKCHTYGIDFTDFLHEAYQSRKWEKWLAKNTADNKFLCSVLAGHYVFASDAYKKLYEKISSHEDFRQEIVKEMGKNFGLYEKNF